MPARIQLASGGVIRSSYDDRGNLTERVEVQIDATTTRTYDPVFSQIESITDAEGKTTQLEIDANGNLVELVDAAGTRSQFAYADPACPGQMTSANGAIRLNWTLPKIRVDPDLLRQPGT
jgi:YD repeat-containing protein